MKIHARLKAQRGVVMLEALIAVFIFSFGVLGLIGMFAASIKNATEAQSRTQAAFAADSLVGLLRTADPATRASTYASPNGADYKTWATNQVYTVLPTAQISGNQPQVVFSGTGSLQVAITINWKANNDTTTHTYVVTTMLDAPSVATAATP
jgi:type IV pilus assembly protein PilV